MTRVWINKSTHPSPPQLSCMLSYMLFCTLYFLLLLSRCSLFLPSIQFTFVFNSSSFTHSFRPIYNLSHPLVNSFSPYVRTIWIYSLSSQIFDFVMVHFACRNARLITYYEKYYIKNIDKAIHSSCLSQLNSAEKRTLISHCLPQKGHGVIMVVYIKYRVDQKE
jgi:hypothetical protein